MTFQFQSQILACWTMSERYVVIGNVVEEMNLFLFQHQSGGNGMHWSVAPSFVEKATVVIERIKVVNVGLRS